MPKHPFQNVAIVAAFNTRQARSLEGHTSLSISAEAVRGVLAAAGLEIRDVDGFFGETALQLIHSFGAGPAYAPLSSFPSIGAVIEAATAISSGLCDVAVVAAGGAGIYSDHSSVAPWTRAANEFSLSWGMITPAHYALVARRHMEQFGTRPEHLATVAATIRNNGHANPEAVYYGRGPFTVDDILSSRMIADPFHLLDCAMTSEGGCAILLTSSERSRELRLPPVFILGGGLDKFGPSYTHAPSWDLRSSHVEREGICLGYIGRRASRHAFSMAGLGPRDVDICEFYDPFSFEVIRQFEAFEFCSDGEGPDLVMQGIGPDSRYPVTTDGGTLAFSHAAGGTQMLQRVARGVHQLQGICSSNQINNPEVVMCSNGGSASFFSEVLLLGRTKP